MLTKVLVVEPVACYTFESEESPRPCCAKGPEAEALTAGYEANGQILAKLAALLQAAIANAPQLIAEISTIIALFGGKVTPPSPSNA